jgi:hypothetical protein
MNSDYNSNNIGFVTTNNTTTVTDHVTPMGARWVARRKHDGVDPNKQESNRGLLLTKSIFRIIAYFIILYGIISYMKSYEILIIAPLLLIIAEGLNVLDQQRV